jgi:RNA-binding protein 39
MIKVYVGNLSRHITEAQFQELVLPFGKAEAVSIPREEEGGRGKGYGFLEFADRADARAVISALNGKDIDGQILNASEAWS